MPAKGRTTKRIELLVRKLNVIRGKSITYSQATEGLTVPNSLKLRKEIISRSPQRKSSYSMTTRHFIILATVSSLLTFQSATSQTKLPRFSEPPHNYWERTARDPFTAIKEDLAPGRHKLDTSSEKAFVADVLKALDIPLSSQILVFQPRVFNSESSTTETPEHCISTRMFMWVGSRWKNRSHIN